MMYKIAQTKRPTKAHSGMDRDSRAERDAKIYACRIDGMPLAAIARRFNLASETVREITRRMERKATWLKYTAQLRGRIIKAGHSPGLVSIT